MSYAGTVAFPWLLLAILVAGLVFGFIYFGMLLQNQELLRRQPILISTSVRALQTPPAEKLPLRWLSRWRRGSLKCRSALSMRGPVASSAAAS